MYTQGIMRLLTLLFCLCAFFSCSDKAFNQDGGDLTRGEVEVLSNKLQAAMEAQFPLVKHKLVTTYVNTLGQSITAYDPDMPPLPYEFRVLRTNEVFVFSLPGGIVYVSLGMMRAAEMEGELAAAIAHELAHQRLNHPLILWRRRVNANRGQRDLLDFNGDWKQNFLGEQGALRYDKGMEEEADRLAPLILYRAHFDPRLYTSYLQLLRKLELSDTSRVAAELSLHPPLERRLVWAKEGELKMPPLRDPNLSSPAFQQIKAILKQAEKQAEKHKEEL